jgi:hypothetical protein
VLIVDLSQIEKIEDNRWRVKETETHYIEILGMLFNFRIVTTPKRSPSIWDRGWCYQGNGVSSWLTVCLAATVWDGSAGTEPAGYFKRAGHWGPPNDSP